MVAPTSR
jgi:hypothetical protein